MGKSYASVSDLTLALGTGQTAGVDDRMAMALLAATAWVDNRCGIEADDTALTPPYTVDVTACVPALRAATVAAAVRFYRSNDAPFGVTDSGAYIRSSIPEAELLLLGQRQAFGIA